MAGQEHEEARARLERDHLAGALSADEYTRLRRELHESGVLPRETPTELPFASWGRRAAAYVLDWIIVVVALTILAGFAIVPFYAIVLLPALYHWLMIGAWGQTVGKKALGVRVVRASDSAPVGYARALARVVSVGVLGFFVVPLLLAYLWPLWDKRNQTLYDKLVDSSVVKIR